MILRIVLIILFCYPFRLVQAEPKEWQVLDSMEQNNTRCVNLTDLKERLPLTPIMTKQILWRTEKWESNAWDLKGKDTLGFPSVVKNIYGPSADNKYYLFYAHHAPNSGIGCAVSDRIDGPFVKLADIDQTRKDSQVLEPLNFLKKSEKLLGKKFPHHFSSPCVLWDASKQLWVMYFHYYKNEWSQGKGHQKTAIATCTNLADNRWSIKKDSNKQFYPVFPTTSKRWMNSQSSYHAIQQLPSGIWLGFLRGTGGKYSEDGKWQQDPTTLGFAESSNSMEGWTYYIQNPIITQNSVENSRKGVLRPGFVGYLGHSEYLVAWSESKYYDSDPRMVYNTTKDFREFKRDQRGYLNLVPADGMMSPWREGKKLYLFSGKYVHIFNINLN